MNFNDFPCNNCGWCCQRTPCPLGLYIGEKPLNPCSKLIETSKDKFECSLITNEINPLKKEAAIQLMLAGKGCSHIYGPSPISLIKQLISQGLTPSHPQWQTAKSNTIDEYKLMASNSEDSISILKAIDDFETFCLIQES